MSYIDEKIATCQGLCAQVGFRTGVKGHDIDDFIQDCIVRALTYKHTYDPERGAFTTWMWMVCMSQRNINRARIARAIRWLGRVTSLQKYLSQRGDYGHDRIPDPSLENYEDIIDGRDIEHYLDILTETPRAYVRKWLDGYTKAEVADAAGVSRQAASASIDRSIKCLRRALGVAS